MAETSEGNLKVNDGSLLMARREVANQIRALRTTNEDNENLKSRLQKKREDLENMEAKYNAIKNNFDVHESMVKQLETDRDRYHKLY